MDIFEEELNYNNYQLYVSDNKYVDKNIHVMNKNESSLCRKLMSQTGLSEKELREHKKYRKMLSDAQKKGEKGAYRNKYIESVWKEVTQQTKLAKEHPISINLFRYKLKENRYKCGGYDIYNIPIGKIDIDLIRKYIDLPYTKEEIRKLKLKSLNLNNK